MRAAALLWGLALTCSAMAMDPLPAGTERITPRRILAFLDDPRSAPPKVGNPDHPDHAVEALLEALSHDLGGEPSPVIAGLETLQHKRRYRVLMDDGLVVGATGSFTLWRELMYLLLGRAYYESGKYEQAASYLSAVPEGSAFAPLARIELGWALLRLGRLDDAREAVHGMEAPEAELQRALIFSMRGRPREAQETARPLGFAEPRLEALRLKILAQSSYEIHTARFGESAFAENRARLQEIIGHLSAIGAPYRDVRLASFAAEVHWNLASLIRTEDPVKHEAEASAWLEKADLWLAPWVERTIADGVARIDEEAFFLSIALLWERDRHDLALRRLEALPRIFPQGKYREDAFQLMADFHFERGRFAEALEGFRNLTAVGTEEKAAYGVYKAAWSFYNLQRKWEALRHLEMLVRHYRRQADAKEELPPGSLIDEAYHDMLLVLSELMPHGPAVEELGIFGYAGAKWLDVRHDLAISYKKLGSYDNAVAIWEKLLAEAPAARRAPEWLHELLLARLTLGQRDLLAGTIDRHYPGLPPERGNLDAGIVTLILTVHREARKTDDAAIWKAADALYGSFERNLGHWAQGEAWYHGAQRKEQLGKPWEAVRWYRRSAEIPAFDNRTDGALSALRILRGIADEHSLKNGNSKAPEVAADYARVADTARWYAVTFRDTPQRDLAEILLVESLYRAGRANEASARLVEVFRDEGPTDAHKDQFAIHNRRLYQAKDWTSAYELASRLLELDPGDAAFADSLRGVRCETAFQAAFTLEKTDRAGARQWYSRCIAAAAEAPGREAIRIKAWHNLLLAYDAAGEAGELSRELERFHEEYPIPKSPTHEESSLLGVIFLQESKARETLREPLAKAAALGSAADFLRESDAEKANGLRWDAVLLHGSHGDLEGMDRQLERLRAEAPAVAARAENRLTAARFYLHGREPAAAWKEIREVLAEEPDGLPAAWITLLDLHRLGSEDVGSEIASYLSAHRSALAAHPVAGPILQPVWAALLRPAFAPKLAEWEDHASRAPASDRPDELKDRVDAVARALKELEEDRAALEPSLKDQDLARFAPRLFMEAFCLLPTHYRRAASRVRAMESPPLASSQWPDFLKKARAKAVELEAQAGKDQAVCDAKRAELAFLPPPRETLSALCDRERCFPRGPASESTILGLERKMAERGPAAFERVRAYLEEGAWARAEALAHSMASLAERSLLLGYLRMALGDPWNAVPLLKEAAREGRFRSLAGVLIARVAWRHGSPEAARRELASVRRDELGERERDLYSELAAGLPETRIP